MNFSGKFGSDQTIWYSASGYRNFINGDLNYVGDSGYYWSASPDDFAACTLSFGNTGYVYPSGNYGRADGRSIRCLQVIDEVAEP